MSGATVKPLATLVLLAGCALPLAAPAAETQPVPFAGCLASIATEGRAQGLSEDFLAAALGDRRPLARVLALDRRQPEVTLAFDSYARRLVDDRRIARGRERLRRHQATLAAATTTEVVEPALLVALWGVETDYGRVLGDFDSLSALLTLACDPRRAGFFRAETLALLRLLQGGRLDLGGLRGSWAGALGQLQFLPSVLEAQGVDLDGDGRVAIFEPGEELFATAARYLRRSGWRAGQPWGIELAAPPPGCDAGCDIPLDEGQRRRLRGSDGAPPPGRPGPARLVVFAGEPRRGFLLYPNIEALLRWNRSLHFAVSVGLLFDQLRAAGR